MELIEKTLNDYIEPRKNRNNYVSNTILYLKSDPSLEAKIS